MRDSCSPPTPRPAYFDDGEDAWVLSRYVDVSAAFRESGLRLVGPRSGDVAAPFDEAAHLRMRAMVAESLAPARLAEWHAQMERAARDVAAGLPASGPVDVVAALARPWARTAALTVTGAHPLQAEELGRLAKTISMAAADPADEELRSMAAIASAELELGLSAVQLPMAGSTFVALSQTLPCFLANAWLALLEHPGELARLHADRDSMPRAIEELHRYCGLARTLYRLATGDVEVAGVRIMKGQRAVLHLASANRDPEAFADADRLDLSRRGPGQLALGAGLHACAGASLIRMSAAIATGAFLERFGTSRLLEEPAWVGGAGFRWPRELWVV